MNGITRNRRREQTLPFTETILTEQLLQYLWQFQYFDKASLTTTMGEPIEVIHPGEANTNQGPDFSDARVRIGDTLFAGTVELHLRTSLWNRHGHQNDANYRSVILHVVYEHDEPSTDGLPVLPLAGRIPRMLLEQYQSWMQSGSFIPCGQAPAALPELVVHSWIDRLVAERLIRRAQSILEEWKRHEMDWDATGWTLLCSNMGGSVNGAAFEALARSIPFRILERHRQQIHQLEALLLGQAGLLKHPFNEAYPRLLQREYRFLGKKYGLQPILQPIHFLRMRPGNFPTVRLAQLAMLLHHHTARFSDLCHHTSAAGLLKQLEVTANDYWHYHYRFDEAGSYLPKSLGRSMAENIIINTLAPLRFAYGLHQGNAQWKDQAIQWLLELPAEQNSVLRRLREAGLTPRSAFDSQGILELHGRYCKQRRCLSCVIGNAVLNRGKGERRENQD
jgi:hypothetical protein